jgi:hypothetical protein
VRGCDALAKLPEVERQAWQQLWQEVEALRERATVVIGSQLPESNTWQGTESLAGFGKVTFRLLAEGKAVMIDAQSTTGGSWKRKGDEVTITFSNCIYTGTIKGDVLAGRARFTVGESRTWTFSVTRVKSASPSAPDKKEVKKSGQ